jgi:hypothetical protein
MQDSLRIHQSATWWETNTLYIFRLLKTSSKEIYSNCSTNIETEEIWDCHSNTIQNLTGNLPYQEWLLNPKHTTFPQTCEVLNLTPAHLHKFTCHIRFSGSHIDNTQYTAPILHPQWYTHMPQVYTREWIRLKHRNGSSLNPCTHIWAPWRDIPFGN